MGIVTAPVWRLIPVLAVICLTLSVGRVRAVELTELISRIKPSIAMVGVYQPVGNPKFVLRGTGFVVGDGLFVATNAHVVAEVVDDADTFLAVQVAIADTAGSKIRRARKWAVDQTYDLAVLRLEGMPLPSLLIGDSAAVEEGMAVAFTGFPIGDVLGFSPVSHRGIVSAITPMMLPSGNASSLKSNMIRRLREGRFDIFQLDATAYPGNSGSPVYAIGSGQVIGILNMGLIKADKESAITHPSGISYAIPSIYLRRLLDTASGRSEATGK